MDQVITYDKSFQQRFAEFKEVLSGYKVLPVSLLKQEWSYYLDLSLDPNGWQAIWKIPRNTCETLKIPFPTIVLVFVLDVCFKDLEAFVKILAVQDDIHIPEKHYASLIHLWPTKDQDKTIALNIESTANAIDMLRFFYTNVYMPWDREDDDTYDWIARHLEPRLRLYYDVKNSIIPRSIAEQLQSLLTEARRLEMKRDLLESKLLESETEIEDNPESEKVQTLMEINLRMFKIKSEVEIIENPLLRDVLIKQQKEIMKVNENNPNKQDIWLIYEEGKVDDYIDFLTNVKKIYPDALLKFSTNLSFTLEMAKSNDIFILNKSTHYIKEAGALESGGILKGISDKLDSTLVSEIESVMLDLKGEYVLLENLTINAKSAYCAMLVREGKLIISNCRIVGDGEASAHQGFIVLANAELEIINSEITNFCTGIVGNSGSKITIENSEIHNTSYGIKVFDNCFLNVMKSSIRDCSNCGIYVNTNNKVSENGQKKGDFDLLGMIPEVKADQVNGKNNTKGNVIVYEISKMKALKDICLRDDLFSNCSSDIDIERSSEDTLEKEKSSDDTLENDVEMQEEAFLNETVKENGLECAESSTTI